jgi:5-methylcytosine-specific restriction endonuclease McrA
MTAEIKTSIALKLHAYGLTQLHDPNWTGMELFDRLKQHVRGRQDPTTLLFKTLRNGLLYHLGVWLYDDYIISDTHRMSLGGEYRLWYLEDLIELLQSAGVSAKAKLLEKAARMVVEIDNLFDKDEDKYWKSVDREFVYTTTDELIVKYEKEILSLAGMYAANYAERVFHDRQLCEHISKTLIEIGFDGRPNWTGPPKQWIRRQNRWPSWAVDAVVARDRGHCGACGVSITAELSAPKHIDHIVALANGGTNDLSNLQLLCDACNLKKRARTVEVRSSVPNYLQIARQQRSRKN